MGCASPQGSTSRGPYFGAFSSGLREISLLKYIRRIRWFRETNFYQFIEMSLIVSRARSYLIDTLSDNAARIVSKHGKDCIKCIWKTFSNKTFISIINFFTDI